MSGRLIAAAFLALAASACVSTDARMLDDRTAVISGRGGGTKSGAEVMQAALVEAAQQTKARGFDLFQVQSATDQTRTQLVASQVSATTVVKPGLDIVVRMYRAGELAPDAPGAYSADKVLAASKP